MKILIASGIFIPEPGGPATYAVKIAEEFLKLGHQVSIITYSDKSEYDFDKDLAYTRKWVKDFDELTYPQPMVDHKKARERCLLAYKSGIS
mgnify:CR=1 FL=1